jgi:hypothetical protein
VKDPLELGILFLANKKHDQSFFKISDVAMRATIPFLFCIVCKDKLNANHLTINDLNELLKLVFHSNVFEINGRFHEQVCGIAMESNFGPAIANMVV